MEVKAPEYKPRKLDPNIPEERKMLIDMACDRAFKEFHKAFEMLAKDDRGELDMSWKEWREDLL